MTAIFFVLTILMAGYFGAAMTRGDSQIKGGAAVIYAAGFILVCALLGYLLKISPGKIITAFGLAFVTWFIASAIFSRKDS